MTDEEAFARLLGKIITRVEKTEMDSYDAVAIVTEEGTLTLHHVPDCCEDVWLESGFEELEGLVGAQVHGAEVSTEEAPGDPGAEEGMWTFYKLATHKGDATLRWVGYSNYYAVDVVATWEVA